MIATVITPPAPLDHINRHKPVVFLAGSIEMGKAEEWQSKLIAAIEHLPIIILNPRRPDWDSSWVQKADNPQFREQVEWELYGLERASLIAMYLAPGTMSPISLLELGRHVHPAMRGGAMIVCCPEGFARKGNVDIVCEGYGIIPSTDWDAFVTAVIDDLTEQIVGIPF